MPTTPGDCSRIALREARSHAATGEFLKEEAARNRGLGAKNTTLGDRAVGQHLSNDRQRNPRVERACSHLPFGMRQDRHFPAPGYPLPGLRSGHVDPKNITVVGIALDLRLGGSEREEDL